MTLISIIKVTIQAKAEPLTRKTSSTPNSASNKYSAPTGGAGRTKADTNITESDHERFVGFLIYLLSKLEVSVVIDEGNLLLIPIFDC